MLSEKQIEALEAKGAKRWTKGIMDRLYFNPKHYGIHYGLYNSGNIRQAWYIGKDGEERYISNSECRRILNAKLWVDITDGKLWAKFEPQNDEEWDDIVARVKEDVNAVLADTEATAATA